ncbi:MAG TPA: hypothetical protein DE315_01900 [Candidatus Omnitrophica bacterium]|nr:hypothetical protein [Candidatus Omnitrophota bacterium]HCI44273.1 hypothetical protein [Candidatus Omnitrophota bacterium]
MIKTMNVRQILSQFLLDLRKELAMVTRRTPTQKDISSIAVRRGISAKRYLPEAASSIKGNTPLRKANSANINSPEIRQRVEKKAYELYEQRGYTNGNDLQDWLEAEQIVVCELVKK